MTTHETTQNDMQRPLLAVNDVARFLAISRDSVYRLVRNGTLPTVKVGDRIRFRPDDIDAYLDQGH